jgi:hypothetical protein
MAGNIKTCNIIPGKHRRPSLTAHGHTMKTYSAPISSYLRMLDRIQLKPSAKPNPLAQAIKVNNPTRIWQ